MYHDAELTQLFTLSGGFLFDAGGKKLRKLPIKLKKAYTDMVEKA